MSKVQFLYTDGFKEFNKTLYYGDGDVKKKGDTYVIFLEGEASLEEAQQILKPYSVEVKKIEWIFISWMPTTVSEEVAKKRQSELELENKVLRAHFEYVR